MERVISVVSETGCADDHGLQIGSFKKHLKTHYKAASRYYVYVDAAYIATDRVAWCVGWSVCLSVGLSQ